MPATPASESDIRGSLLVQQFLELFTYELLMIATSDSGMITISSGGTTVLLEDI